MNKTILLGWTRQAAVLLAFIAVHFISEYIGDGAVSLLPNVKVGWLPLVMAGVSAAGSILGSVMGNNQVRKQRRALEDKQRRLDAWRDAALGSDYLSRADSQAALRTVRENMDEQLKAADTEAIKGGMTDEARAAYASRLNRGYADVVSQIAGMGEKYRDRVRDMYMQQSNAIDDAKMGLSSTSGAQNLASGITSAASTLSSLMGASSGRGATTAGVQPSQTVKNMASSGYLPGYDKYKINI